VIFQAKNCVNDKPKQKQKSKPNKTKQAQSHLLPIQPEKIKHMLHNRPQGLLITNMCTVHYSFKSKYPTKSTYA